MGCMSGALQKPCGLILPFSQIRSKLIGISRLLPATGGSSSNENCLLAKFCFARCVVFGVADSLDILAHSSSRQVAAKWLRQALTQRRYRSLCDDRQREDAPEICKKRPLSSIWFVLWSSTQPYWSNSLNPLTVLPLEMSA